MRAGPVENRLPPPSYLARCPLLAGEDTLLPKERASVCHTAEARAPSVLGCKVLLWLEGRFTGG